MGKRFCTSSSDYDVHLQIPQDLPIAESCVAIQQNELWLTKQLCRLSPLLAVVSWACTVKLFHFVVFLRPLNQQLSFTEGATWLPAWAIGLAVATVPWLWKFSLEASSKLQNAASLSRLAPLFTTSLVLLGPLALNHPAVRWTFCEWSIIRTPNPSFARNTLFWEQRKFEQSLGSNPKSKKVALIGSSQIYQATDTELICKATGYSVEKNCLAGMGPIQYSFLEKRILERSPDICVLWLSEFDFYREDEIPSNRLRWAADFNSTFRLLRSVSEHQPFFDVYSRLRPIAKLRNWDNDVTDVWRQRGEFADLTLASISPAWRNREHFQQVAFWYWWNLSSPINLSETTEQPPTNSTLAQGISGLSEAKTNLQNNLGEKRMLEVNFAAFENFCRTLTLRDVRLVVVEGQSQPGLMRSFPNRYRNQTRQNLSILARKYEFEYLNENKTPRFSDIDFSDPYHLNSTAKNRFSQFLVEIIRSEITKPSVPR